MQHHTHLHCTSTGQCQLPCHWKMNVDQRNHGPLRLRWDCPCTHRPDIHVCGQIQPLPSRMTGTTRLRSARHFTSRTWHFQRPRQGPRYVVTHWTRSAWEWPGSSDPLVHCWLIGSHQTCARHIMIGVQRVTAWHAADAGDTRHRAHAMRTLTDVFCCLEP
jgi:hypothetical protein